MYQALGILSATKIQFLSSEGLQARGEGHWATNIYVR